MNMRHIAALLMLLSTSLATAGPFGFEAGEKLTSLTKKLPLKKERDYVYSTSKAPNGHPDFEMYNLLVTPTHGLCKISAVSKTVRAGAYGTSLISKFDQLEAALSAKYGKADRSDFLKSGSIWSEDNDWMMSLYTEERVLNSLWTSSDETKLPDQISAISLEATALNTTAGYISLRYEFASASDCIDFIRSKRNSPL